MLISSFQLNVCFISGVVSYVSQKRIPQCVLFISVILWFLILHFSLWIVSVFPELYAVIPTVFPFFWLSIYIVVHYNIASCMLQVNKWHLPSIQMIPCMQVTAFLLSIKTHNTPFNYPSSCSIIPLKTGAFAPINCFTESVSDFTSSGLD